MASIYSTSSIPQGIPIYANATLFPPVAQDGEQAVAADTNTLYIYDSSVPGWQPVANPGAAIAIDALTGEVTATGPGVVAATITNAAVTNAKLAAMADNTVKGNKSGLPASPSDLALSDVTETVSNVLTISNGSKSVVSAANLTIQVAQSSAMADGYLSAIDWSTFNSKQNALTFGDLTGDNNANISVSGGTGAVIGMGTSISQSAASALAGGYLTSADWSTFNSKVDSVSGSAPISSSGGTNPTISISMAGAGSDGYLTSADWNTFNSKQPAGSYITALTGEVTATGPGSVAATISANAVTNAKLAKMATNTIKGNNTAGPSDPLDLTTAQTTAMLDVMQGDGFGGAKGLVPAQASGDATKYLRGDATWQTISLLPAYSDDKVLYSTASAAEWRTVGTGSTSAAYPTKTIILGQAKPVGLTGTDNIIVGTGISGVTNNAGNVLIGSTISVSNPSVSVGIGYQSSPGNAGVAVGYSATANGNGSVAIGQIPTSGDQAVSVGYATVAGNSSVSIGTQAKGNIGSVAVGGASGNVGANFFTSIGYNTLASSNCVTIGNAALSRSSYGIAIGDSATTGSGSTNLAIGYSARAGQEAATGGAYNTVIGANAGGLTTGASNVLLGYYAGKYSTTQSNELFIDNQDRSSYANQQTKSLLYGVFNATETSQTLRINAQTQLAYGEKHASVHGQVGTANVITATVNNYYIGVDSTLAAKTVNLPAAATAGAGFVLSIKDEGGLAATNNIVIDASGGELIDGALTQTIAANYGSLNLICSGTAWFIN